MGHQCLRIKEGSSKFMMKVDSSKFMNESGSSNSRKIVGSENAWMQEESTKIKDETRVIKMQG